MAEDGERVLRVVLQRVEHVLEDAQVRVAAVDGGLAADERLERVADHVVVGDRGLVPLVAHHEVVEPRARGGVRDEHPAAGAGARGQHPAHLEQPDRLVDRGERDTEAGAQLLLRAEPLAGTQLAAGDLLLELACDRLSQRDARVRQEACASLLPAIRASVLGWCQCGRDRTMRHKRHTGSQSARRWRAPTTVSAVQGPGAAVFIASSRACGREPVARQLGADRAAVEDEDPVAHARRARRGRSR